MNRSGVRWNSSRRKSFVSSTHWAQKPTTPRSLNAWWRQRRSWRKFASKFKILNKQFFRTGILFVISAPSGAGKTTLLDGLRLTPDSIYSVSCTTRAPRTGEVDGEDYHFITEPEFLTRVEAGEFLEHAKVHDRYYGTLMKPLVNNLKNGVDVLVDID